MTCSLRFSRSILDDDVEKKTTNSREERNPNCSVSPLLPGYPASEPAPSHVAHGICTPPASAAADIGK